MNRADALLIAITAILRQRQPALPDAALRGLVLDAKLEKDGTVRVIFFTPNFVAGAGVPQGAARLSAAVVAALEESRDRLNDAELRGVEVDAWLETNRKDGASVKVRLSPTYTRATAEVGLRRAVVGE